MPTGPAVKPGPDGITISVLPDENAILASMRAGQTDFALLNDPLVATLVPGEANMQLNRVPGLAYNVLQLNPSRKPMDDLKVRQAISCAVNRQEVVDTALAGEGAVTGPLTMPSFAEDPNGLFCYKRDVDKAKALMKESSSPDGFGDGDRRDRRAAPCRQRGTGAAEPARRDRHHARHQDDGAQRLCRRLAGRRFRHGGGPEWRSSGSVSDVQPLLHQGRQSGEGVELRTTSSTACSSRAAETDPAKRVDIFHKFEQKLVELSPWVWLSTSQQLQCAVEDGVGL